MAVSPTDFNIVFVAANSFGSSADVINNCQTTAYSLTNVDVHGLMFVNGALYGCTDGGVHRTNSWSLHLHGLGQQTRYAKTCRIFANGLLVDVQFTRNPPVGPALRLQSYNRMLQVHVEFVDFVLKWQLPPPTLWVPQSGWI